LLVRSTSSKSSFLSLSLKKFCTVISKRTMFCFQMLH
jgi:ribosomal protein L33